MITEKKETRGRKPVKDKKVPLTIYVHKSRIKKMGGIEKARKKVSIFIDSETTE